jgi:erythromycin esterase-like protein
MTTQTQSGVAAIRSQVQEITGVAEDYDSLLEEIGDAHIVLIGEASHGTHEFYRERARISRRLIEEKGFRAVLAEADWPDAYRVNCYVRGRGHDNSADEALGGFKRFPTWMWRNTEVVEFIDWLRDHNRRSNQQAGFYGLDLYSMYASMDAVLKYLDEVDPDGAARARYRYSCFEDIREDSQAYGYAANFGLRPSCENEAVRQLTELLQQAPQYLKRDGAAAEDDQFYAEQNARLVKNAEEYYRSMFGSGAESWNLRDQHMAQTLDQVLAHLDRQQPGARVVVWEHNSHVGDARATEMSRRGELNVGQLVRQRHADDCYIVGFSTYEGSVTAASDWDGRAERKRVRPGLEGSYERLFHEVGVPNFLLSLRGSEVSLPAPRLERAIGVIYRPQTERMSHYFDSDIQQQFDTVLHFDETRALEPLEVSPQWTTGEPPETYPTGQ